MSGLALGALVASPLAQAAGGSLAGQTYGGAGGQVQSSVVTEQETVGTLPFTGLGLGLFIAFGLVLVATGIVLRRKNSAR